MKRQVFVMKKEVLALTLICLAVIFWGWPILFGHASPFRGDISLQFYPWKVYTQSMLSAGEIPYWNPYAYGGAPFLANIQSAVFYPLDLILFVFPIEWFFGLSLMLHLILAAIGTYLLARICGATPFPSIIASIAYGLSGFTMIHIPAGNHLTYAGAAWIPWMLWVTTGFVLTKKSRLPWALGGAFITWMHFLCGHPQMTFYSMVFSFLLCIILGFWMERRSNCFNPFALLLGIAMAGMQLIPTLEYFLHANRAGGLTLQSATEFSFAPHRLITLLCPEYYGTMIRGTHYDSFVYWSCAYAGAIIPFLALIVILRAWNRYPMVAPLSAIAFLGLLLAWGRGNPVYAMIFQLPGFGHFRAPAKYIPYYLVSVSVLGALGVEYLSSRVYARQHNAQDMKQKKNNVIISTILLGVLFIILIRFGLPFLSGLANETMFGITAKISGVDSFTQSGGRISTNLNNLMQLEKTASLLRLAVILGASIAAYIIARRFTKSPRFVISLALGFILFLDLHYFGQNYLQISLQDVNAIRQSTIPTQGIGMLRPPRKTISPDRIMNRGDIDYPNVFMHWRLHNIAGYDPMSLSAYNQQIGLMEDWKGGYHDNIQLYNFDHPVLDLLNVRYVLTAEELNSPAIKQCYDGSEFRIYERLSRNRAWAMAKQSSSDAWMPIDSEIEFTEYSPHRISFKYSTDLLVDMRISEWHYPGWKAQAVLMDHETQMLPIEPSDEGLRCFKVPMGTVGINIFYQAPRSGWVLSCLSGAFFSLLLLLVLIRRNDRYLYRAQRAFGRDF
jgi:hypothetical protein